MFTCVQICSNLFKTCSNVFKTCSSVFKCVQTCLKPVQMCSNGIKLVQNLLKWVQMCSNGFKTSSNLSNVFQPVQNLFKCVQNCSKIIRLSSARGLTWQAELDLVFMVSESQAKNDKKRFLSLLCHYLWSLPSASESHGGWFGFVCSALTQWLTHSINDKVTYWAVLDCSITCGESQNLTKW